MAHSLSVYFWNVSDNGFRVNDSVPNNNTVLTGEFNLIWIHGNSETVLYLSGLKFRKQTSQPETRGRQLYEAEPQSGLISYLSPSITRFIPQCFLRPFESSRLTPTSALASRRGNYSCRHSLGLFKNSETTPPPGHPLPQEVGGQWSQNVCVSPEILTQSPNSL